MIHVAAADEGKGRIVLQLTSGAPSAPVIAAAIEAAVWLACAFQSEIEGLFVENEQLIELARHPVAREISHNGKSAGAVSLADIERQLRFASADFHKQLVARAGAAEVPCRQRVVRGDPVAELVLACTQRGPWNVVALAEPFDLQHYPLPRRLFELVTDTTGVLLVGPRARHAPARTPAAPIVLVVEDPERLPAMLGVAERLSAVRQTATTLCLLATDAEALADLDWQARLVVSQDDAADDGAEWTKTAKRSAVDIVPALVAKGSNAMVAEMLRRLAPGFAIGQSGGLLVPDDGDLQPLAAALECPLLLVR